MKTYKALITDVDGTLIPLGTIHLTHGLPTPVVSNAIQKARDLVYIGIATSRPLFFTKHLFTHLSLSGPSIVQSGSLIVDSVTHKILYEKQLEKNDFYSAIEILHHCGIKNIFIDERDKVEILYTSSYKFQNVLNIFVDGVDQQTINTVREELLGIPTISLHQVPAWNRTENKWAFNLAHGEATKQHAIFKIAKMLNISPLEIIGVGDGHNDFPLLMACGLKVAMGNAVNELKTIADYIAPSVSDDGLADVINRFILKD